MWWNHDWGWTGWLTMTVGMIGFWVLLALLVLLLVRAGQRPGGDEAGAQQILEKRLARGDIGVEEYHERLEAMRRAHR